MLAYPTTPVRHGFTPQSSSPLAGSSPLGYRHSEPRPTDSSRRRATYKSQARTVQQQPARHGFNTPEAPQMQLWRDRFKAKCAEKQQKDRQAKLRRRGSMSSDGDMDGDVDMDGEDDEGADEMDDELYRRIIAADNRRLKYAFRVSYEDEVGSSIDPDMEDVGAWETELQGRAEQPLEDEDEDDFADQYQNYLLSLEGLGDDDDIELENGAVFSSCPACSHRPVPANDYVCENCKATIPLAAMEESWQRCHGQPSPASHYPLSTCEPSQPDRLVVFCAADDCEWSIML